MQTFPLRSATSLLVMLTSLVAGPTFGWQGDADTLNSLWSKGFEAFESGKFDEAKRYIEQVIEIVPFESSSRILRARCQVNLGDVDGALNSLKLASELGWEDSAAVEAYEDFKGLADNPGFRAVLATMEENGQRPYFLYTGESVDPTKASPLIVLYHGRGELPGIQLHFWKDAADQAGFYVLALKGTRELGSVYSWEKKDATKTWQVDYQAILDETKSRIKEITESKRISEIVLAGFSQGGVAALEMLRSDLEPRPKGGVVFSTAFPEMEGELFADRPSVPECSLVMHVGKNDRWLAGNQAAAKYLTGRGTSVDLHVWDGIGHQMPEDHTQVIVDSINEVLGDRRNYLEFETPIMIDAVPSPGIRVRQVAPEYEGTEVYHSVYLPINFEPGNSYPVIVEYTGNKFPPDKGSGEVKDANFGYGLSGGEDFIWIVMPYVAKGGQENAVTWWGDRQATIDYCKANLPRICKRFGGDLNNVVLCGFSRGAIGASYIGLADDEIAGFWKAIITHDHFDGHKTWKYAESDRASALERLSRLDGRPVLVCNQETINVYDEFLKDHLNLAEFTFLNIPTDEIFENLQGKVFHPHTDLWMHRESDYRLQTRQWLARIVGLK